jgi:N-acetylglucosamine-6-sulfatase
MDLEEFERRAAERRRRRTQGPTRQKPPQRPSKLRSITHERRIAAIVALLLVGPVIVIAIASSDRSAKPEDPNFIVVMTDDQTFSSYRAEVMPRTAEFFSRGTVFSEALAVPPLCCPARSGFLTGQYAHNHGVLGNTPGYPALRHKGLNLASALQADGYRTAMLGKFLNGYEFARGTRPAPGWDRWLAFYSYPAYFNYEMSDDGTKRSFGEDPSDYSTRVITDAAVDFIRRNAETGRPFFAWLAYNAPHVVGGLDPPCAGSAAEPPAVEALKPFRGEPLPQPASFDEADMSDKPDWAQRPLLSDEKIKALEVRWRCGLATLRALDRSVGKVISALEASGELDNTVIIFLSDNGYFFGEHRRDGDKRLPLEPALHVPMAISVPDGLRTSEQPGTSEELVSTVDLAPTVLDYAEAEMCAEGGRCATMDGRSLRPLLEGSDQWPRDRGIPVELSDGFTYEAVRTPSWLYVEMSETRAGPLDRPAVELYDLQKDPDQLVNLAGTGKRTQIEADLAARLDVLRRCSGIEREGPPRPPPCE